MICRGLPGKSERPSWGQPAWFGKTLMARIWEDGVLTVKTEEREALAGTDPGTYFWTPQASDGLSVPTQQSPFMVAMATSRSCSNSDWPLPSVDSMCLSVSDG